MEELAPVDYFRSTERGRGQNAVEYGILLAVLSILIVLGAHWFGMAFIQWLHDIGQTVTAAGT